MSEYEAFEYTDAEMDENMEVCGNDPDCLVCNPVPLEEEDEMSCEQCGDYH